MKTPSSDPRRPLRRAGSLLALAMAAGVFVAVLAALALFSATFGGPALVELGAWLSGR